MGLTRRGWQSLLLHLQKNASEEHLASGDHVKKLEEDAIGTMMCGEAKSTRRFNGDLLVGPLTKKSIMEYWGAAITNMPQAAKEIHFRKKAFYINSKTTDPITPDEAKHEVGIVSYPGTGKYKKSKFARFHDLPDSEEVATEDQLRFTAPQGQGWFRCRLMGP